MTEAAIIIHFVSMTSSSARGRLEQMMRVLQCVAALCSVLQCVAVCCSALQCVAVCCSALQCVAVCCGVLKCSQEARAYRFCVDDF